MLKIFLWSIFIAVELFILIAILKYIINSYKTGTVTMKVLIILIVLIVFGPVVLYLIDRMNLATILEYDKNVNLNNWFSFFKDYFISIISSFINTFVVIYIAVIELKQNYEDNQNLNKENVRLQNLPCLKISCKKGYENDILFCKVIDEKGKKTNKTMGFSMMIQNIGLNAAKSLYICNNYKNQNIKSYEKIAPKDFVEPRATISQDFIIENVKYNHVELNIEIIYQDLLNNWYSLKVKIIIEPTNVIVKGDEVLNINVSEGEEIMLDSIPKELFINNITLPEKW